MFGKTLVMDMYPDEYKLATRISSDAQLEQEFQRDLKDFFMSKRPAKLYRVLRNSSMVDNKFCIMTSGGMAMVHGEVEVGDRIFIARGASVPLVIRAIGSGSTERHQIGKGNVDTPFELVGGAYLHGAMDGEFLRDAEENNLVGDTIRIL